MDVVSIPADGLDPADDPPPATLPPDGEPGLSSALRKLMAVPTEGPPPLPPPPQPKKPFYSVTAVLGGSPPPPPESKKPFYSVTAVMNELLDVEVPAPELPTAEPAEEATGAAAEAESEASAVALAEPATVSYHAPLPPPPPPPAPVPPPASFQVPSSILMHGAMEESSIAPEPVRPALVVPVEPGESPPSLVLPTATETPPSGSHDRRPRSAAGLSTVIPTGVPTSDPGPPEYTRIGDYRVIRRLGEGGMGIVYEVDDEPLGRRLALKLMKRNQAIDPDSRARFLREARAMAALTHDHIVPVYTIGEHDALPYLTMPVLVGKTLDSKLQDKQPLPVRDAIRIARQISRALAAAHAVGLIHRDVKPANVWLEFAPDGGFKRVRLLDFGLARTLETAIGPNVTRPQQMIGTPAFMAPEQVDGKAVDHRADLFSVGAVLYQMLTGKRAFPGDTVYEVLDLVMRHTPPPAHQGNALVPLAVSKLVERLLQKDPTKRPQTAAEVVRELWTIVEPQSHPSGFLPKVVTPPPKAVAGYPIVRELGRGSAGVVYEARRPKDDGRVAMKVQHANNDPATQARFRRTARLLRDIQHPCVMPVEDVSRADSPEQFFTMPVLLGKSLKDRLAAPKPIPLAVGVQIARQVARGLAAVHTEQLGHGALRPSNIWLETNATGRVGGVRVMDVGLADPLPPGGLLDASQSGRLPQPAESDAEPSVAAYIAPEQIWGQATDHRSDLFSLGCILYELATSAPAFAGADAKGAVQAVLNDYPPAVHRINPAVPPRLANLIARMLAKDPTARPADALLVAKELANCLNVPAAGPVDDVPSSPADWRKTFQVGKEFTRTTIGIIYEVTDPRYGQQQCILEAAEAVARDSAAREAFVRAAKQMATLHHPYIVPVLGVGEIDRQPYMVLPLLPGRTLKARILAEGPLPLAEATAIAAQTAGALAAAHARGVIHGSVKPSNLWLVPGKDGEFRRVRVFDVGLARAVAEAAPGNWYAPGSIAPEQVRGYPADDRTDLFGLGSVLYESITGRRPFDGETVADVLDAVMRREPTPACEANPAVPQKLSDLIRALLQKDPSDRPDAASDVARELAAWAGPLARGE